MSICPKCGKQYLDRVEFCEKDGARLIRGPADTGTGKNRKPNTIVSEAAIPDRLLEVELRKARSELAARDARISELEAELADARLELETMRRSQTKRDDAATVSRPATAPVVVEPKPAANRPATAPVVAEPKPTANRPATAPVVVGPKPTVNRPATAPVVVEPKPAAKHTTAAALEETVFVPVPYTNHGWLVCTSGLLAGQRFAIGAKGIEIGRSKRFADAGGIAIKDNHVSNPHAWVGLENGRIIVRDEGSSNGTYLKDSSSERITECPLAPGTSIIIVNEAIGAFVFKE
jgi:FHA domain